MSTQGIAFIATVCKIEFCISTFDVVDDTSVEPVDIRLDEETDPAPPPPPEEENLLMT